MAPFQRRATVHWTEPITERVPITSPPGATGFSTETLGERMMECAVEIEIDLDTLIRLMGKRAGMNKTGRCQGLDGKVKVKRVGKPREVSRRMKEKAN